jgi:hypothetical protein
MILSLALLAGATGGGALATYLYEDDAPFLWRACAGAATGLAALGLVGLLFSTLAGFGALALVLTAITVASPASLLLARTCRKAVREDLARAAGTFRGALAPSRANGIRALLVALLLLGIWRVNDRVIFERADGIYTGVTNNIGDLPFHIAVITRFLEEGNVPPENPIYSGTFLTYTYLADFVTAIVAAAGADLRLALLLVNLTLMCALAALAYHWVRVLTSDRGVAALALPLLLLNGGFGWWQLLREMQAADAGLPLLFRLPHDYTIMSQGGWRWGNLITSLLLPQRAFLLGLPLALVVFTLWARAWDRANGTGRLDGTMTAVRHMAAAGVVAGLLPLAHVHSYAVVMAVAACLALWSGRLRLWMTFLAVAIALGLPQMLWLASGSSVEGTRFVGWHVGWDHGEHNVWWFWLKNTGVMIPLVLLAIFWRGRHAPVAPHLLRCYLPFIAFLVIPNVVRLSPWIWDNIKIMIYWHVASAPLAALVLVRLWRDRRPLRIASAMLVTLLTLAGALDVWRVVSGASEHRVFTREGIAFASVVRDTVPAGALLLHAPTYNHPVFLSGRRSFMGYPGHLWSHGLTYEGREAELKRVYSGAADAEQLLVRRGIGYIVVGPLERELLKVDEGFLTRFPVVATVGKHMLMRVAPTGRQ